MSTIDSIRPTRGIVAAPAAHSAGPIWSTSRAMRGLLSSFALWLQKRETRSTLRDLTDDQLRDIGLTRREARTEVSKSFFWD
ncbi:MAG: DUF1127 domain-containing protein [Rhizobium sp.]